MCLGKRILRTSDRVGSRLAAQVREQLEEWRRIGAGPQLLHWIAKGVAITFTNGPPPSYDLGASLTSMTEEENSFMEAETSRLLKLGAWEEIDGGAAHCVNRVHLVPKLNHILQPQDFMVALDLTDGYFHLDMAEESRTYMAFRIGKRLFRMAAVPFGWNHAPSAFTKLLEPVVAHLRQPQRAEQREVSRTQKHIPLRQRAGHRHARLLWYMDDFLLAGRTAKETAALRDGAAGLFAKLGLTPAGEVRVGTYAETQALGSDRGHEAGDLPSRRGQGGQAPSPRTGPAVRGSALAEEGAKARAGSFRRLGAVRTPGAATGEVPLTRDLRRDRHAARMERTRLTHEAGAPRSEMVGTPPGRGYGLSDLAPDRNGHAAHRQLWFRLGSRARRQAEARGYWTSEEAEDHITLNELRAVTRAVTTFRSQLEGKTVQHFEDNMGVVHIINGLTTRSPAIMAELRLLWRVLDLNGINLLTEYINTKENVHADALSRLDDEEDWQLNPKVFRMIDAVEQHSVDRFATALNALLPRFNSRWEQPGAEAVNSLALSDEHWRSEKNWCNPPWSLLPTLADKLEQSGAAATVVTPDWPRENWAAKLDALAIEVTRIPAHTGLFIPGRRRTAHGAGAPRWDVVYKVQQGAIAPWADAIRKRMERIAPGDPDGLTDWIGQSLSAGSYRTYGGTWRMFQKYCDEAGVCSLPATSYTVACYLKWLGERGTVQKKSLKPYLSVINTVHKDLGYRQRPAIGALVKSMKQAYGRKVIRIRPAPRILVMPARIILDMWRRVEKLTALPDLEYITKLPEIRALLACIVCYITGSRPSSIALLPLTGVAFALGSELGIQRSYVKTAPDACDFDVPGRRTVSGQ
ncbi:reverse transcriptase domain-containing protein [Pseudoscourfieldia marina]